MRRSIATTLAALVLLGSGVLTGCGHDDAATDPAPDPTSTGPASTGPASTDPSSTGPASTGPVSTPADFDVTIVSATGAGGAPDEQATAVDDAASLRAFTAQFRAGDLAHQVREAVAKADGDQVYAAVIGLGCDVPPGATARTRPDGAVVVTPAEVASPLPECFAPVTSVAVLSR